MLLYISFVYFRSLNTKLLSVSSSSFLVSPKTILWFVLWHILNHFTFSEINPPFSYKGMFHVELIFTTVTLANPWQLLYHAKEVSLSASFQLSPKLPQVASSLWFFLYLTSLFIIRNSVFYVFSLSNLIFLKKLCLLVRKYIRLHFLLNWPKIFYSVNDLTL